MNNRKYILAWIVIYFLISCSIFTGAALAEDVATPTQEGTEVVVVPPVEPTAEVTVEPTNIPENPPAPKEESKPFDITPFIPFIVGVVGVVALGVLTLLGVQSVLLFKSQPIAWAIAKPLLQTGVDAFVGYTKADKEAWNDALGDALEKKWAEFMGQVDAKVEAKVNTKMQAVTTNSVGMHN